jgi:hypothetical protein
MARKKFSSFFLGLFVTGGFVILAAILIWIGASQYFEGGQKYVSYFDESIQGLEKFHCNPPLRLKLVKIISDDPRCGQSSDSWRSPPTHQPKDQ